MNCMSHKESLVSGCKQIRRELAACLICLSLLVFTGTLFSDSDDPHDEDYVGDNEFCGFDNTVIQQVYAICSPTVNNNLNSVGWAIKLKELTDLAQTVDVETYWMPDPPFVSVSGTGPYTCTPWSDTWGICVYFEKHTWASNPNAPDVVDSVQIATAWTNALLAQAPDDHCWMVGLVTGFGGPYDGAEGMTEGSQKLTIMKYNVASKLFLHEYGHTGTHRVTTDEVYG